MKILAIETSCDETAISVVEATENSPSVLSHIVNSQINLHQKYGGVFPSLAKREHGKNLVPALVEALNKANLYFETNSIEIPTEILETLEKNPELQESFKNGLGAIKKPEIDYLAVTEGPGLEPALWAGISFAKALSMLWDIPLIPINHMEGHLASVLLSTENIEFPALALLVSGGHTELVLASSWGKYQIIGQTLDDAVGEAFDKVARLLGFPYPGGPQISRLASKHRKKEKVSAYFKLPRPMLNSDNLSFSFSGLKTAVRYALEKTEITLEIQQKMAREFEDAVVEVLVSKTLKALGSYPAKTLILAGGVSANTYLRKQLKESLPKDLLYIVPEQHLSTDNATMIALAAYTRIRNNDISQREIVANGNLQIDS